MSRTVYILRRATPAGSKRVYEREFASETEATIAARHAHMRTRADVELVRAEETVLYDSRKCSAIDGTGPVKKKP